MKSTGAKPAERMGTRLYEALLNKCETLGETTPGLTLEQIEQIGREELEHFLLINRTITKLSGDPTVQSPCADVAGVTSMGIMQVLTEPTKFDGTVSASDVDR